MLNARGGTVRDEVGGSVLNAVRAEVLKLATVPSTYLAAVLSVLSVTVLAQLNPSGEGFSVVPPGSIGVIVLGVLMATGDGAASVLCVPRRWVVIGAKVLVLTVVTVLLAGAAVVGAVRFEDLPELGWRVAGVVVYWVCMALMAFAVGVLARSAVVPLVVFVVNSAVVSGTFLLTKVTRLAAYLPDVAGAQMFVADYPAEGMLSPVAGGVTMVVWTVVLVAVAGAVFARRDVGPS